MAKTSVADALAKRTGKASQNTDPVEQAYDAMFGLETSTADNDAITRNDESIAGITIYEAFLCF